MGQQLPYSPSQKEHRTSLAYRIVLTGLGLILLLGVPAAGMIQVLRPGEGLLQTWLFSLAGAVLGVYLLLEAHTTWLITSPEGIEYHHLGRAITAGWQSARSLERGTRGYLSLQLRSDGPERQGFTRWLLGPGGLTIPLTNFFKVTGLSERWREDPLISDLLRYAPHLFPDPSVKYLYLLAANRR